jgi:hypothetical protein
MHRGADRPDVILFVTLADREDQKHLATGSVLADRSEPRFDGGVRQIGKEHQRSGEEVFDCLG